MAALGLLAAVAAVSGCSASSKVQVGQITFTDTTGTALKTQPTSLAVNGTVWVAVDVTNDPDLLGADWTVYCGSALPPGTPLPTGQTEDLSCGSVTPTHTVSGPIPSYVTSPISSGYIAVYAAPSSVPKQGTITIYAAATKDHSRVSSWTLTITQ
jgi:hypothetical protein